MNGVELIVIRLIDMDRVHPSQDNSRVCSKCGHPVGIFPTGREALKKCPQAAIVCSRCVDLTVRRFNAPAGTPAERIQEHNDAQNIGRA